MAMQRAMGGERGSISLELIQERSSKPEYTGPMCPLSPATIEAYQSLGVDPEMLRSHSIEYYMKKYPKRKDLAKIEYRYWEGRRMEAFASLISKRDTIRAHNALKSHEDASRGEASRLDEMMNSMAAREEHRLEMAKRQREKEQYPESSQPQNHKKHPEPPCNKKVGETRSN